MSSSNSSVSSLLAELNVVVSGLALAHITIRTWRNFSSTSTALHKISQAKTISIPDLRSLLSSPTKNSYENLVIIRGLVDTKPVTGSWWWSNPNPYVTLPSPGSPCVVLQNTKTFIYKDEWGKGNILGKSTTSIRKVPFILKEDGSSNSYAIVDMDGSSHELPLTQFYRQIRPFESTVDTYVNNTFMSILINGHPNCLLVEKNILPLGKEITAIGKIYLTEDGGIPNIRSCQDLPYFLSDMTKDQMLGELACKRRLLFWIGIMCGLLSVGVLGFACRRYWQRYGKWFLRKKLRDVEDEGSEGVAVEQLCGLCSKRKRRMAFVPCGHLISCRKCAVTTQNCPLCGLAVNSSVIIYVS
ncbi:RING-type E3 ubiquitin transferase [Ranunculus cassubicifolius]